MSTRSRSAEHADQKAAAGLFVCRCRRRGTADLPPGGGGQPHSALGPGDKQDVQGATFSRRLKGNGYARTPA